METLMCYHQTECVIANYFDCKETATELKLSTLNKIKNAIESHFLMKDSIFVYVDTSWDEISSVIETYTNYFGYNDNYTAIKLKTKLDAKFIEDQYSIFNSMMSSEFVSTSRNKIIEFLKDFIENHLAE